ncbi:MAG TPA: hypothetical protein VEX86_03900 [Longimicrobium sp.]|nr:hypothetical protein [Longimicrobium sp.]
MMRFVPRLAAAAALALGLAACEDPLGGGLVPVRFTVTERPTPEFAVASEAARSVTVRGTFGFSSCDEIDPDARLDGNTLVFRLEADGSGGACLPVLEVRGYRAEMSSLEPDTYHVRVEHVGTTDSYDGTTRPDGVRFEANVTVR